MDCDNYSSLRLLILLVCDKMWYDLNVNKMKMFGIDVKF